ncbi:hypothetical protein AB0M02_16945 [Actinoplanes sp. NPDC051861]|uniref:hypothetical protein n=1 Tax=Actinoplanes sp. NPDC051861 TaxID=3155170 RepID=UPI003446504A
MSQPQGAWQFPPEQPNAETGENAQVPATVGRAHAPAATEATPPAEHRSSAPAVTSAPLARPLVPPPPGPPDVGTGDERERTGPSGRTGRLHVGWHAIGRTGLRRITLAPQAGAGLVLGVDRARAAVPLKILTPDPVRITLAGHLRAAQILIFRAFALGARAIVVTTDPQAWSGFGERATGQYNRLTVLSSDQGGFPPGTAQMPTLSVYDLGATGPATAPSLGPWHTRLTILRQLDRPGIPTLQEADLVAAQRLGTDEAILAASALRLTPESRRLLETMADDMIALFGDGPDRFLQLLPTPTEQQHIP